MKWSFLVILVCLRSLACLPADYPSHFDSNASRDLDSDLLEWLQFKTKYEKVYTSQEEDSMRFANFLATKQHIECHNAYELATYKMGLNRMSDWSAEEFGRLLGRSKAPKSRASVDADQCASQFLSSDESVPEHLDWRDPPSRVGRVKDQGSCGSCWAFATTGLLEGQQLVRNISRTVIELSEQHLIDCSGAGCNGGSSEFGLSIIKENGVESEADYGYTGEPKQGCHMEANKSVMKPIDSCQLEGLNENELKMLVARYGPVAASIDGSLLRHYQSGVLTADTSCASFDLNHEVLIVGYGKDERAGDYWLLKNCWNTDWGDSGFFKIGRGTNVCGVAMLLELALF